MADTSLCCVPRVRILMREFWLLVLVGLVWVFLDSLSLSFEGLQEAACLMLEVAGLALEATGLAGGGVFLLLAGAMLKVFDKCGTSLKVASG